MKLKELLHDIVSTDNLPDLEISSLCSDSRQVSQGSLFFALPGSTVDGNQFLAAAAKGGAVAILSQSAQSPTLIPLIQVNDVRSALARAASRFFLFPSKKMYMVGITGTNGKTTLTYLLEKFWQEQSCGIMGTINFRYNKQVLPAPNTTPDTLTIQSLLHDMQQDQVTHVAMEVSSHGLQQKRASACSFNAAVFTNLTQDHLDYHENMENYYQAKKLLFSEELACSSKNNKLAVIDSDDPYGKRLVQEIKQGPYAVKTFSLHDRQSTMVALAAKYSITGTAAEIQYQDNNIAFKTNLIGEHNLRNIMAALLIGEHSGCDLKIMLSQLENIRIPGRLDRVEGSNCFVDYAHTPDALSNVLQATRKIMHSQDQRLIVVFGCGGDRDQKKRPLMGEIAAKLADIVMITSDNPRTEKPKNIIQMILPGVTKYKKSYDKSTGFLVEENRKKAIETTLELAQPQDVIIIAGKGHEDYQIIGTEKKHFDDREVVKDWMKMKDRTTGVVSGGSVTKIRPAP